MQAAPAFSVTGVDYWGPFYYKPEVRNKPKHHLYRSLGSS